jgi:hypothetical protein
VTASHFARVYGDFLLEAVYRTAAQRGWIMLDGELRLDISRACVLLLQEPVTQSDRRHVRDLLEWWRDEGAEGFHITPVRTPDSPWGAASTIRIRPGQRTPLMKNQPRLFE